MTFYSHSKTDEFGVTTGSKILKVHIKGVLANANENLSEHVDIGLNPSQAKELLKSIVLFHDLGKYTSFFQNYLLKQGNIDNDKKRHPPIGGFTAYNILKKKDEKQALIALKLIFQHHGNLVDISQLSKRFSEHLKRIVEHQKTDLQKNLKNIENDLRLSELKASLFYPEEREVRRGLKIWSRKNQSIQDYFLINYLFSLLIEADKLDASDTSIYKLRQINPNQVDIPFGIPEISKEHNLKSLQTNELRNHCRAEVVLNLNQDDILNHYLFTLTAPTGIGKTMTALDFAIKLKSKIKKEEGIESRIIYALPFINIIEQALNEYNKTLADAKVLGHYQYSDIFGEDKKENSDEDGSVTNYNQKMMSVDTWQADVVITSFVQFFETLIGNRNKLLKKFHHFANSIIILDEVQTLRLDHMPLIGAALHYLSKFLKARIILMTATKPKIFDLAQEHILRYENEQVQSKELLKSHENVFAAFERTKIVPLLNIDMDKDQVTDEFISQIFSEKWSPDRSCLIVCNTVNRSIEIFNAIKVYLKENHLDNEMEYLSTNIIPAHRFERINKVKALIESQSAPILISTQVVEAGVDLDFDMGFRDLGPIDSIIQVAGRINRNNNPKKKFSPLFIVNLGDSKFIYKGLTTNQAVQALNRQTEFPETEYLNLINSYFDNIAHRKSFDESINFFNSMKALRYDSEDKELKPVSSFKIIEESKTTSTVFVELGEYEIELRERYLAKIKNEISKEKFDKNYKHDFQQRIISVPSYLTDSLSSINEYEDNILVIPVEELDQHYKNETGYIRLPSTKTISFL